MKKLLIFLLIFSFLLISCQPAEPTSENNETNHNQNQTENQPTDSNEDNTSKQPSSSITNSPEKPEKKPPLVPITNKDDPQDESADFLFVFDVKYGEFVRGGTLEMDIEMTNNMETSYTWVGSSSSFIPWAELYCMVNGEKYRIFDEGHAMTDDVCSNAVKAGEGKTVGHYFKIPADAPLGEYTLRCSFSTTETEFTGYFTLK